jgi:hypothetical protein
LFRIIARQRSARNLSTRRNSMSLFTTMPVVQYGSGRVVDTMKWFKTCDEFIRQLFRRCRQFSLKTLIVAVTFITMLLSHIYVSFQNSEYRRELGQLRSQLGYFVVEDTSKGYVLQLKQQNQSEWTWRVHLPKGIDWSLCLLVGQVPLIGFPDSPEMHRQKPLPSDFTLHLRVVQNHNGSGEIVLTLNGELENDTVTIPLRDSASAGFPGSHVMFRSAGHQEPLEFGSTAKTEVFRYRALPLPFDPKKRLGSGPTNGLLIWLDPKGDSSK